MLQVIRASGVARKKWLSLALMTVALVLALSAVAVAAVKFVGGPGTEAPPQKLGGVTMQKFGKDTRGVRRVTFVSGPTGDVTFGRRASHRVVGRTWKTWSHHYRGDVYFVRHNAVTLHLPANTKAFYLYAEPNSLARSNMTVTSGGAGPGPVSVNGKGGARFFGFVAKDGSHLKSVRITVSDVNGFAVGEFGIAG